MTDRRHIDRHYEEELRTLRNQILEMGWELGLPVAAEDVSVERQGIRTTASARYVQEFEFFPNNFRPLELDFVVDTYSIYPGVQDP